MTSFSTLFSVSLCGFLNDFFKYPLTTQAFPQVFGLWKGGGIFEFLGMKGKRGPPTGPSQWETLKLHLHYNFDLTVMSLCGDFIRFNFCNKNFFSKHTKNSFFCAQETLELRLNLTQEPGRNLYLFIYLFIYSYFFFNCLDIYLASTMKTEIIEAWHKLCFLVV